MCLARCEGPSAGRSRTRAAAQGRQQDVIGQALYHFHTRSTTSPVQGQRKRIGHTSSVHRLKREGNTWASHAATRFAAELETKDLAAMTLL